jgi:succinate-semialdehyde dehydrogenase/glutarate-semialdehyde dehydrogenase
VLDVMAEAGLPRDVLQVVLGAGDVVGPWLIDEVDYVMFTGSTRVGRIVAAQCGERLIPCSMELGGKNAMIIRADADPERAAEIAVRACFSNAGQLCISMERIYVNVDVYDAFLAAFVRRTRALRLGTQIGWGSDMGSLISEDQVARAKRHVDDAVSRGAKVLAGGRARPDIGPWFFEPTILANVTEGMEVCDEETFGPVVAVHPVHSDDEAVRLANDTEYGLNAAVIGRDRRAAQAAEALARPLDAPNAHRPAAPWPSFPDRRD